MYKRGSIIIFKDEEESGEYPIIDYFLHDEEDNPGSYQAIRIVTYEWSGDCWPTVMSSAKIPGKDRSYTNIFVEEDDL
jgi:hypothetical protein